MLRAACCCAVVLGCAGQGVTQVTETRIAGLTWLHLPDGGAAKVGMVLAWPVGGVHDPHRQTGLAQAVRAFLELAQLHLPPRARFVAECHDGFTLLWSAVAQEDLSERLDFLGRVLGGRLQVTGDLYSLALARARLLADDNTHLYPGPALHNKARRVLFPQDPRGRQLAGIPGEIAGVTRAELRARYLDHYGSRRAILATVGGMTRQQLESQLNLTAASGVDRPPVPVQPGTHPQTHPEAVRSEIHPRVDAPYVSLAMPMPADRSAAFLVAVGAMRHQAYLYFGKPRGKEWLAGFEFVRHQWLTGDPMVMINRRGRSAGSAADVRQEILGFLASIRGRSCGLAEKHVAMARQEILNTLERPRKGDRREVAFRARIMCLRRLLGFDDAFLAQVAKVEAEEARSALLEHLREDRGCWLEFLPDPKLAVRGFSARQP